MNRKDIFVYLKEIFPDVELSIEEINTDDTIRVPVDNLHQVMRELRDNTQLKFDFLLCLSGVEINDEYQVVYHLFSMQLKHHLTVRCGVPKVDPVVMPTVSDLWSTADWHEREVYDMFGIHFEDHPDLRRILCPDDWKGFPLRKDYVPQESWHGIPLVTNLPPVTESLYKMGKFALEDEEESGVENGRT